MLPQIIDEQAVFIFKFWFDDTIQYGMYHRNELFCRLGSYAIQKRPQIYQFACRLAHKQALTVLTCTAQECSLWGNLRSPLIKELLLKADKQILANRNVPNT